MHKKMIWFLCLMFLGIGVKAIDPVVDYASFEGIYSNRVGAQIYSGKMAFLKIEGEIVYCLEPFQIIGKNYAVDNTYLMYYSQEDLLYYELVAHYGYHPITRNHRYYYMAAQELIWERLIGVGNIYWTTGNNGTGEKIDIQYYKDQILKDVQEFYLKPSFENTVIKLGFYEKINVLDSNHKIDDYEYYFDGNSIVSKIENGFSIKMLDTERKEITLTKEVKTNVETTVYVSSGSQTIAKFGLNALQSSQFFIENTESHYTNLSIEFYDIEKNEIVEDIDFIVCNQIENLPKEWIKKDNRFYYPDRLHEDVYAFCEFDKDYILISDPNFSIFSHDLDEYTEIQFLVRKRVVEEDYPEDQNKEEEQQELPVSDLIDEIDIEEEKQELPVSDLIDEIDKEEFLEKNIIQKELPNTSNYLKNIYYILYVSALIGIALYVKKVRD